MSKIQLRKLVKKFPKVLKKQRIKPIKKLNKLKILFRMQQIKFQKKLKM